MKLPPEVRLDYERRLALEYQRVQQQGHGSPIVTAEFQGQRIVAVGNQIRYSRKWKTFHDFLTDSIKSDFGLDWGKAQTRLPYNEQHPVMQWASKLADLWKAHKHSTGQIKSARMNGAAYNWFSLAYDLYCLRHNAELKARLMDRLRNPGSFPSTRYEAFVAAAFIRAGFTIAFEDEDGRGPRVCEFIATSKKTGKKFAVEAKHRSSKAMRIERRLINALGKQTPHERIICIELNTPQIATAESVPDFMELASNHIRRFERARHSAMYPPAFVLLTNMPHASMPESDGSQCAMIIDAFKMQDYHYRRPYPSVRHAWRAKVKYRDIFDLADSISQHTTIPSTFDGKNPEFAFAQNAQSFLQVGQSYLCPDGAGGHQPGVLEQAIVMESEKKVFGTYRLRGGKRCLITSAISDSELDAYRRHPETFFGVRQQAGKTITSLLQAFEWWLENFAKCDRQKLLAQMRQAEDFAALENLSIADLREVCAERYAHWTFQNANSQTEESASGSPPSTTSSAQAPL